MLIGVDGFRSIGRPGATVTRRRFTNFPIWIAVFIMTLSMNCARASSAADVVARRVEAAQLATSSSDNDESFLVQAPTLVRKLRLYNRCSGGYLQMYLNQINARGKNKSPLVDLRVETDSFGSRIRIQFEKFNKYLCFNRRKRITSKYNGDSQRCVFVERISDNHYTEIESAWTPGLFVGFNRQGRYLDPSRYDDRRTCFQFIKSEHADLLNTFQGPVYGPAVNISQHHRFRHSRLHHRRNQTINRHNDDIR